MDPIELLKTLRASAEAINALADEDDISDEERNTILDNAMVLAEGFDALDKWMDMDGFSPWAG